ncbi:MAG TPA: sugar isomerase domain-containing protein [Thermotogota bacterium]|nr:sugar isomerase domain-containing protein [Thermotogota bacterium]HPJ88795.1 sugar isomerase domain-containing protein [Thermotogota bacterium]HPR96298.1 sugar isomerase domain-containing protein [Thermotogota bacterium]
MAYKKYLEGLRKILNRIENEQGEQIETIAGKMAESIQNKGIIHFFGSGHSVIPVLDAFPRYGSFLGLNALMDPRLMWSSVTGPASAPGLLKIERKEDFIEDGFLRYQPVRAGDFLVVYSHGGLNAAPVEAALFGKKRGATVVAVTSIENQKMAKATHSSGKKLIDIADYAIDNCVPPEDAIVELKGRREKVGATSTTAVVAITLSLVCETAEILNDKGFDLKIFVSPNVEGFGVDNNLAIFDMHSELIRRH